MKRRCVTCSADISAKPSDARFCSRSCAARTNNRGVARNRRSGRFAAKPCTHCAAITTNPRFCSLRCCHDHQRATYDARILASGVLPSPHAARQYLRRTREHRCAICGIDQWCGKPVPLIVDHINGNPSDDRITNLRLVCGNCDMQLPTYKSRNLGNGRAWRRQRYAEGKSY